MGSTAISMQASVNILGVRTSQDETEYGGPPTGLLHVVRPSHRTAKCALVSAVVSGKGVPSHFSVNSLGAKDPVERTSVARTVSVSVFPAKFAKKQGSERCVSLSQISRLLRKFRELKSGLAR